MEDEHRVSQSQQKFISSMFDLAVDIPGTGIVSELENMAERYSNEEQFASGGLKEIKVCQDEATGRKVAKAVLREVKNESDVEVFLREARIAASLQHPNIVPVYDIGLDDQKRPFFTMKLIEGKNLNDLLKERQNGKDIPLNTFLEILLKVTDAVSYAHSKGVLHLDIKPDNIQISDYGEVLLCDWGLAKIIEDQFEEEKFKDYSFSELQDSNKTLDGFIKGTPGYLSPEQASPGQHKDQRSDIYSLGALLYEIITLEKPVKGKDVDEILKNTVEGNIAPPGSINSQVPSSLAAICMKALKTEPDHRYQSATDLYKDTQAYMWGYTTEAEDAGFIKVVWHFVKRNAAVAAVTTVSTIILIISLGYFIYSIKESEKAARKEKEIAVKALEAVKKEKEVTSFFSGNFLDDLIRDAERAYDSGDLEKAEGLLKYAGKNGYELLVRIRILQNKLGEAQILINKLDADSKKELTVVLDLYKNVDDINQQDLQSSLSLMLDIPPNKVTKNDILKVESLKARQILLHRFASSMEHRERAKLIEKIIIQEDELPPEFELVSQKRDGSHTVKVLNGFNKFKSIHYLKYLEDINTLHIRTSAVTSFEGLSAMPIITLTAYDTPLTDISALKEMPLRILHLDASKIKDFTPLFKIDSLEQLHLIGAKLTKQQEAKLPPKIKLFYRKY